MPAEARSFPNKRNRRSGCGAGSDRWASCDFLTSCLCLSLPPVTLSLYDPVEAGLRDTRMHNVVPVRYGDSPREIKCWKLGARMSCCDSNSELYRARRQSGNLIEATAQWVARTHSIPHCLELAPRQGDG